MSRPDEFEILTEYLGRIIELLEDRLPERPKPPKLPTATQVVRNGLRKKWEQAFEHFYKRYPRKVAKQTAYQAWMALCPKEQDELRTKWVKVVSVLEARKATDWDGREQSKIPYPATFLRAEGFEDEDAD